MKISFGAIWLCANYEIPFIYFWFQLFIQNQPRFQPIGDTLYKGEVQLANKSIVQMYNQTTTWIPLLKTFFVCQQIVFCHLAVLIFPTVLVDFQDPIGSQLKVLGMGTSDLQLFKIPSISSVLLKWIYHNKQSAS